MAAFFIAEAGGKIEILKLVKLIYLGDRQHLQHYDNQSFLIGIISMPHGPVNSLTLNFINAVDPQAPQQDKWDAVAGRRVGYHLVGKKQIKTEELDRLSRAEAENS